MSHGTPYLLYLLQFDSFQTSIRMWLEKLSENRLAILACTLGGIILLILIFRFLARKK